MFTKPTLHTRKDGSKFMLDIEEYEYQQGKANEIVVIYNKFAETLSKYKETQERAKKAEYLRGVLKGGMDFIENSRAEEIYTALETFPLGERAKASLVAQTIDEFSKNLSLDLKRLFNEYEFTSQDMVKPLSVDDDLEITEGKEKCLIKLRTGFLEEVKIQMTRELSEADLEDGETFKKAIRLLWSLVEKGYYLGYNIAISPYDMQPVFNPSAIDKLIKKEIVNDVNGREEKIKDDEVFNILKIPFRV